MQKAGGKNTRKGIFNHQKKEYSLGILNYTLLLQP